MVFSSWTMITDHQYTSMWMLASQAVGPCARLRPTTQSFLLHESHPICKLEAINTMVALKCWTPQLRGNKLVLDSDSATAVSVFQAGKSPNSFIQACAREILCACAVNDIYDIIYNIYMT